MNYNAAQFTVLVDSLKILNQHFDIKSMNKNSLHYLVYQNFSEGQKHNWLMVEDNTIVRNHKLNNNGLKKLIPIQFDFELYPKGCNDSHVETAVKNALKQIN